MESSYGLYSRVKRNASSVLISVTMMLTFPIRRMQMPSTLTQTELVKLPGFFLITTSALPASARSITLNSPFDSAKLLIRIVLTFRFPESASFCQKIPFDAEDCEIMIDSPEHTKSASRNRDSRIRVNCNDSNANAAIVNTIAIHSVIPASGPRPVAHQRLRPLIGPI